MPDRRRGHRRATRTAAAAAVLLLSACGSDGDAAPEARPVPDNFAEHVGESFTISAEITRVITPLSFVVDGSEYGDRTLLVLTPWPLATAERGDHVTATGTVREFDYGQMQEPFALTGSSYYRSFTGEVVLSGASLAVTSGS